MTAKEIEDSITFVELPVDPKTEDSIFKAVLKVELYCRLSRLELTKASALHVRSHIMRDLTELMMRKLYDDQRESLYKALYDLRAADPMSVTEQNDAVQAVLSAALRQPPKEA